MKKFRRIIAILCLVVILVTLLTACGKTGKCENCGKTAKLKKFTYEGESAWVCDDCYNQLKALTDLANAFK